MVPGADLLAVIVIAAVSVTQAGSDAMAGLPMAKLKGNVVCCPQDSVVVDGWASIDVGGSIVQWAWDLDADGKPDSMTARGELRIMAPSTPKLYVIILQVRDNQGNVSMPDTGLLHVMESRPTVSVGGDITIKMGTRVFFRPSIVSHCAKPKRYEWDFDGDEVYEYQSPDHGNTSRIYYRPGKYRAKFRVVDAFGKQAGGIRTVIVSSDAP